MSKRNMLYCYFAAREVETNGYEKITIGKKVPNPSKLVQSVLVVEKADLGWIADS